MKDCIADLPRSEIWLHEGIDKCVAKIAEIGYDGVE